MNTDDCLSNAMFMASESYSSSSYGMAECTEDVPAAEAPAVLYSPGTGPDSVWGANFFSAA